MNKRNVVICGNFNFPRGSATANYVQYLALALIQSGYDVKVISTIERSFLNQQNDWNKIHYKGMDLFKIEFSSNKYIKNFQLQFLQYKIMHNELKKINLRANDIIIVLSSNNFLHKHLQKYGKQRAIKVVACVLEWHESTFFRLGKLDFRYWQYLNAFHRIIPKHDAIIPISTYIDNYYRSKGCKTLILPIMADTREYGLNKRIKHTKKFIFPANGKMKDDLYDMLKAIALLDKNCYKHVEFHFCGIKENTIKKYFQNSFNDLKNNLIFIHKWMSYNDLVKLYQQMDFLLISRKTSRATLANFPSKVPEVMSHGVIPVVSKVGDYTSLYLEDGINSIQFLESESISCLKAIERAIKLSFEEQSNMSAHAFRCAQEKFDYRNWIPLIKRFFDEL